MVPQMSFSTFCLPRHPGGTSTAMIRQGAPQAGASRCLCQIFDHGHNKWQGSPTFSPFELFGVDQICVPKTQLQNGHTEPVYSDVQWFQNWSGAFGNRTAHNSVHSCLVFAGWWWRSHLIAQWRLLISVEVAFKWFHSPSQGQSHHHQILKQLANTVH